jgi:N-acetylmuramoyl-L-alanine amidase
MQRSFPLWVSASILSIAFLTTHAAHSFHVMIDPGHGGVDTGAVHSGLKESGLVLDVALRLQQLLKQEPSVQVSLTREDDRPLTLPERVRKAESQRADLLISLHANAAPDPKAKGLEFFFQNSLPADEDALFLANLENQSLAGSEEGAQSNSRRGDVAAIVEDLRRHSRIQSSLKFSEILNRGWSVEKGRGPAIKQAPLYVVSRSSMPSVLVELGFLTHPSESKRLAAGAYRDELARKIKNAVIEYRQSWSQTPQRMVGSE